MIQPRKWSVPLGSGADVQDLPDDDLRYASFSKIFPQITQVPLPAGGVAPRRIDFNSLFKLLADNIYYYQNGGVFEYSATADYEKGALVRYNDKIYLCIQDNSALNTHNPDDMDYWLRVALNNELADYLPIAGGNLTGNLTVQNKNVVRTVNDIEADINGNIVIESGTSFLTGQLIQSIVPLNDAMLHLADGALISGSGSYAEFVTLMAGKVSTNPELFCTETEWQTSNTNYGFCGKFVYDDVANTVRLPKVNSQHGALIKSYQSGDSWYRIYQDGWCEQGNSIVNSFTSNLTLSVSLIKEFTDTNYFVVLSRKDQSTNNVSNSQLTSNSLTTSSFVIQSGLNGADAQNISTIVWQACGYTDISDLQVSPIYEYIVVGTVSKTDIQIDIDNVMADLANKADKDFSNITAPVQAFKNMSVGWGMPDYSSGIDIGSNFATLGGSWTAPSDGFVQAMTNGDGNIFLYTSPHSSIADFSNLFIYMDAINDGGIGSTTVAPIKKGQTIYQTSQSPYNFKTTRGRITFYPCKGAN